MNQNFKLLALLCALLMVVGCLSACGKKDSNDDFAKLCNAEKLFYYNTEKHPTASNVVSLVDLEKVSFSPAASNGKYEAGFDASLNKLVYQSSDLLQALGGNVKLGGTVITDLSGVELDLGATFSGITLDVDIAADDKGLSVSAPALITKPIYAAFSDLFNNTEAGGSVATDTEDGASVTAGVNNYGALLLTNAPDIAAALQKWYEEKLTEKNIQHLISVMENAVPESAITVSKATPDELMGEFITSSSETECVTATITEAVAKQIANSLSQSVSNDETVKDIIASFIDCFGDELVSSVTGKTADELYNELMKNVSEISLEVSDESKENGLENGVIVINRYFIDGYCVKTDITAKDNESTSFDFTVWNVYSDSNACQYGVKLAVDGETVFTVIGGANASEAKLNATLNIDKNNSVSLDVQRTADEFKLNAKANIEGALLNAEYTSGADTTTAKFGLTADGVIANADYSANATGSSFTGTLTSGLDGFKLEGTSAINGDKTVYNYTLTGTSEGTEFLKGTVDCECETLVNGTKTEKNVSLSVTVGELLAAEADIKLTFDTNTDKQPEKPTSEGAYVITDETSYEGISDILTDLAKQFFGGASDTPTTNIDPDVVGLWAMKYDENSLIYFEFYEDGYGIYGTDYIGYGYLYVETNVETDELTLYYLDEDGNVEDTYVGSYYVSDGTLYLTSTSDGYTDELVKIEGID